MSPERENNAIRQLLKLLRIRFDKDLPYIFIDGRYHEENLKLLDVALTMFCIERDIEVDLIKKGIAYEDGDTHYSRGIVVILKEIENVSDSFEG